MICSYFVYVSKLKTLFYLIKETKMNTEILARDQLVVNELGEFTIGEYVGIINMEFVYRAHNCSLNKDPAKEKR